MGRSLPDGRVPLPREVPELALDLLLDVERRLALALTALVAGLHELADLLAQARVDGRLGEPSELVLDVELGLALAREALVLGHEELADLLVALGPAGGRRRRPRAGAPILAVLVERQPAAPDLRVHLARPEERDARRDRAEEDDDEYDDPESLLHQP